MMSQLRPSPSLRIVRDWVPSIYLLQGYWLCGLFFRRPMRGVEQRLLAFDRWLFDTTLLLRLVSRAPRVVTSYFELTYLLTYPFVPVSFGVFLGLGQRAQADNFWTAVLIASFGCYGMLPWIQTRPPRSVEGHPPLDARHLPIRRLNVAVLDKASVQVNTFPSGHAATAVAAALAVASTDPWIGAGFVVFAASIVVATVLGRYHYALDSILGLLVGIGAWWVA